MWSETSTLIDATTLTTREPVLDQDTDVLVLVSCLGMLAVSLLLGLAMLV